MTRTKDRTNEERGDRAYRALLVFTQYNGTNMETTEEALTDLLADLMHMGDDYGTMFEDSLQRAREHYETEINS